MRKMSFTVRSIAGRTFPVEMLYMEKCWPASPIDAFTMQSALIGSVRNVAITLTTKGEAGLWEPNRAEWRKAGWSVDK